jgi:hypothetical protein
MGFYSKRHYDRISNGGPDTPGQVGERVRRRAAGERAHREMLERFSPLTSRNVAEAFAWQDARIQELMK